MLRCVVVLVGGPHCCLGHEVNGRFDVELKTSNDGGDTESVVWPKAPLHSCLDSFSIPLDQHGRTNVHELHPFGYNPANCCHVIAESETHLKVRKVES